MQYTESRRNGWYILIYSGIKQVPNNGVSSLLVCGLDISSKLITTEFVVYSFATFAIRNNIQIAMEYPPYD